MAFAPTTLRTRTPITPDRATVRRLFEQGDLVPVYRTLLADLETPVSVYLKLAQVSTASFLLESVEGGEQVGRYSFLGVNPKGMLTVQNNIVTTTHHGVTATRALNAESGTFTYTGQDATLTKTAAPKEINAEAGTFSYLGQDATLNRTYSFNAEAGTFSYLGQDATLTRTVSFNAEAGTFTYTGQAATLNRSYSFNAEAGSFSYISTCAPAPFLSK